MRYGWVGKILRIDLSTREISHTATEKYQEFIGGRGIAAKIFYDEVGAEVGAFDAENKLLFMTGPLTGTPVPGGSGRSAFYSKSPVGYPREVCAHSSMGGSIGAELKYAGYDGVILEGKADKPVYILIEDEKVEIKDASELWGLDTYESQRIIKKYHGTHVQVASIGPAGENLYRMAAIVHGTGHAAGQSGFGAVMGAKKLKAIAVKGSQAVKLAKPKELLKLIEYTTSLIYRADNPPRMSGNLVMVDKNGGDFYHKYYAGKFSCSACPIACQTAFDVPGVPFGADSCKGQSLVSQDPLLNLEESWAVNQLVNRLGLSTSGILQVFKWLVSMHAAGLITEKETGLTFSNHGELLKEIAYKTAYRQGFGDIIAELLPRAANKIGAEANKHFIHFNGWGLAISFEDLRLNSIFALQTATGTLAPFVDQWSFFGVMKGIFHLPEGLSNETVAQISQRIFGSEQAYDGVTFENKAAVVIHEQNYRMLNDSLILCRWVHPLEFSIYQPDYTGDMSVQSKLFSCVTGEDMDETGLLKVGDKIFNLERMLGIQHGYRSKEHDLQVVDERHYTEPHPASPFPDKVINKTEFMNELTNYYRLRGWDEESGMPTEAKLKELSLRRY